MTQLLRIQMKLSLCVIQSLWNKKKFKVTKTGLTMTHFCKLRQQKVERLLLFVLLKNLASLRLLLLRCPIYLFTMEASFNPLSIIIDLKARVFNQE